MSEEIDWSLTTFEGNRRRQHEEFLAMPLREKLLIIEQMEEVAELLADRRAARKGAKDESEPRSVRSHGGL